MGKYGTTNRDIPSEDWHHICHKLHAQNDKLYFIYTDCNRLPVYLSVCLSVCLSVLLCVCLLSLSTCLTVCLCVYNLNDCFERCNPKWLSSKTYNWSSVDVRHPIGGHTSQQLLLGSRKYRVNENVGQPFWANIFKNGCEKNCGPGNSHLCAMPIWKCVPRHMTHPVHKEYFKLHVVCLSF